MSNSWDSITPYCQVPSLIIIKRFCLDSPNVTLVYGLGIDNTNTRSVQIEGIVYLKKNNFRKILSINSLLISE